MNRESLECIVKIINLMEKLIINLDDRTVAFRCAVSDVVKNSFKNTFSDYVELINKTNLVNMHMHIHSVPSKKSETKKKYINNLYNILTNRRIYVDEEPIVIDFEFLEKLHKELSSVCELLR